MCTTSTARPPRVCPAQHGCTLQPRNFFALLLLISTGLHIIRRFSMKIAPAEWSLQRSTLLFSPMTLSWWPVARVNQVLEPLSMSGRSLLAFSPSLLNYKKKHRNRIDFFDELNNNDTFINTRRSHIILMSSVELSLPN